MTEPGHEDETPAEADESESADEVGATDEFDGTEEPICLRCACPVSPLAHFCPHCNAPLTSHATTDFMGQVYSTGYMYSQATSSPRNLIVVIGIWLIVGPMALFFAIGVLVGLASLDEYPSIASRLLILLFGAAAIVLARILWRTTVGYLRQKAAKHSADET